MTLVDIPMKMNLFCSRLCSKADISGFYADFIARQLASNLQLHVHSSALNTITRDTPAGISIVVSPLPIVEVFSKLPVPYWKISTHVFSHRAPLLAYKTHCYRG